MTDGQCDRIVGVLKNIRFVLVLIVFWLGVIVGISI